MDLSRRVVITGMGMVTPLGNDTQSTWQGIVQGRSGIGYLPEDFGLADYPVKVAGFVQGEQQQFASILPPKMHSRVDRFIQLGLIAGHEAMTDAGLSSTSPEDRTRFGVYMGVGVGGLSSMSQAIHDFDTGGPKRVSPFAIPKTVSNLSPGWLAMQWNLQGPLVAVTNACASSTDALGLAFRQIRDGYADYMLAGGAESCVLPVAMSSFGNMRALTTWSGDPAKASCPFDRQRSGFVMAEGAAVLVLERADKALERGAKVYAEIVGYGATSDAYHITAMHPEGRGAVRAMQDALADASILPSAIGYINAHGTSTPMGDALETMVLKKVFGQSIDSSQAGHILVSSTKSMTGHMLGAAGAAEAAFSALALHRGIIPPTINLSDPDPACDLDYVADGARSVQVDYALSNSFGFGGGNAVLALKRWVG